MSKIACVFAHPDDEAFGPGGTIASLSQDHEVHLICVTDGDVANTGLKQVRAKELLTSADILGIAKVHFLDFVDGSLSNATYRQVSAAVKSKLDELQPETVITFDENGFTGHIDHIAVTSIVNWLFPKLPYLQKVMFYCMKCDERDLISDYFVYMPTGRDRTEVQQVIDISSCWDSKLKAMHAHKSQSPDCEMYLKVISNLPKEEWFRVRSK